MSFNKVQLNGQKQTINIDINTFFWVLLKSNVFNSNKSINNLSIVIFKIKM